MIRSILGPFLLIIILFSLSTRSLAGQDGPDFIESQYDSVRTYYQKDYPRTLAFLDTIQQYTLERCALDAYFKALKWSIQCAMDHHQLDLFRHYLTLSDSALLHYADELEDSQKRHEVDIKGLWASYYFKIASYSRSIDYHLEIIDYLQHKDTLSPRDREMIARSYQYLGTIEKLRGESQQAIAHFWTSLDYIKEVWDRYEQMGRIAFTYKQIGHCYTQMGDLRNTKIFNEKALESLKKVYYSDDTDPGARLRLKKNLITTYNSIAAFHLEIGENDKALQYLQESLSHHVANDTYLKATYNLLGEAYAAVDSFEIALDYYEKSLREKIRDYGPRNYSNGLTYLAIGKLYARRADHRRALEYFDQAIANLTSDPKQLERLEELDWNSIYAERELLTLLHEKAKSAFSLFQSSRDSAWLQQAWRSSRTAVAILEGVRRSYHSNKDEQFLLEDGYPVFEMAILAGYHLGSSHYPELFELAEKSKAVLLVDLHQELNALEQAAIPDSLLEKEQLFAARINFIEDLIDQEHHSASMNTEKVREHYKNLAVAKQAYSDLLRSFKERYRYEDPRTKKARPMLSVVQRKLLRADQTLVEYFQGDDNLFIFAVNQDHITVQRLPLDFPLAVWVDQFRYGIYGYHLSPQPSEVLFRQTQALFAAYGQKLYKVLLGPVEADLQRELIIIPDGLLGYLPFEALLTDSADQSAANFAQYPYLLKEHQLSYCYSASLLSTMQDRQYHASGLLAFAPTFPKAEALPQAIAGLRAQIDTLYYNIDEVETIKQILKTGTLRVGKAADKAAFLKLAPNYKIIHLASHGILNDSISDYSYIAFYGGEDQDPDHNLLVKDLHYLRLEAELVTLSACETGLGELRRGEGIISLARGFAQAGAKSMLTTLWAVNDASTTEIMEHFYHYLQEHKTKDEAIHLAKMDYLHAQSDPFEAHPFYWASFIPIGDMQALETRSATAWPFFILLLIVPLVILLAKRLKKRLSSGQASPETIQGII